MGKAVEKMIEGMDPVDRLELARDVVHSCRVYVIGQIAAVSRSGGTQDDLAPWEALKDKFNKEYDLILFGRSKPEEQAAAIDRAINEHRRFLIEKKKEHTAPKGNIGDPDGGPK